MRRRTSLCYSKDMVLHSVLIHGDKLTHPAEKVLPLDGITLTEQQVNGVSRRSSSGPHGEVLPHGVELRRSSNAEVLTDQHMRGETGREARCEGLGWMRD